MTPEERRQEARDDARANCIGCHLGICTTSHDEEDQ